MLLNSPNIADVFPDSPPVEIVEHKRCGMIPVLTAVTANRPFNK